MQAISAHNSSGELLAALLGGTPASTGKKAVFIRDDKDGRGRKLYRHLKGEIAKTGRRVFELSDIQSIEGFVAGQIHRQGQKEPGGLSLSEQSLLSALQILGLLSGQSREAPLLLSLQNVGRWDAQTALLVRLLLEARGNVPGSPQMPEAVILALEDESPSTVPGALGDILAHPDALRFHETGTDTIAATSRTLDGRTIRPLRLCQLACLPLTPAELKALEGAEALAAVRRCGVDAVVEGRGNGEVIVLCDGISPFLGDSSTLPAAQLREYHAKLLAVFEGRGESDAVSVARFHHAVKACRLEAVQRWFARGVDVLVARGKAEEAVSLLRESLLLVAGREQAFGGEPALRRKLADLYAGSGRPLQAFQTLTAGGLKALSIEDWYLVAQTALEAGNVRQSQEAIDTVLNGAYLDPKSLLPFKVLQCEIEYGKGNYDGSLRMGQALVHEPLLMAGDRLRLLNNEGRVLLATRQFKKAERLFAMNLAAASAGGFHRQAIVAMINIAVAKIRLGYYAQALRWLEKALAESRRRMMLREEAIAVENIATIHHLERAYQKALASYTAALSILKFLDCHELLARVANNIGELSLRFGDIENARRMLAFSNGRLGDMKGSLVAGEGLLLSGRIAMGLGNFADAAESFVKAAQLFRSTGAEHLFVEAVISRAGALLAGGLAEEAGAQLDRISALVADSPKLRAMTLLCRARVLVQAYGDARPALEEAVKLFRTLGDREGELECLIEMIQIGLQEGRGRDAARLLRRAEALNAMIRCDVPSQHGEAFDHTPPRRKLGALKARIRGAGCASGEGRAQQSGDDRAGCDIMKQDEGAERTAAAFERGTGVDLRVLLSEGISLAELKNRIERRCIEQAMAMSGGNISKAASLLGMKRPRLSQLVKQYRLGRMKKGSRS